MADISSFFDAFAVVSASTTLSEISNSLLQIPPLADVPQIAPPEEVLLLIYRLLRSIGDELVVRGEEVIEQLLTLPLGDLAIELLLLADVALLAEFRSMFIDICRKAKALGDQEGLAAFRALGSTIANDMVTEYFAAPRTDGTLFGMRAALAKRFGKYMFMEAMKEATSEAGAFADLRKDMLDAKRKASMEARAAGEGGDTGEDPPYDMIETMNARFDEIEAKREPRHTRRTTEDPTREMPKSEIDRKDRSPTLGELTLPNLSSILNCVAKKPAAGADSSKPATRSESPTVPLDRAPWDDDEDGEGGEGVGDA